MRNLPGRVEGVRDGVLVALGELEPLEVSGCQVVSGPAERLAEERVKELDKALRQVVALRNLTLWAAASYVMFRCLVWWGMRGL